MNTCKTYLEALTSIEKTALIHVPYYIVGFLVAYLPRPQDIESAGALFGIITTVYTFLLCSEKLLLLCSSRRRSALNTVHFQVASVNNHPNQPQQQSLPSVHTDRQKAIFTFAVASELGIFCAACKKANENEIGPIIPIVIAVSFFLKGLAYRYRKEIFDGLCSKSDGSTHLLQT